MWIDRKSLRTIRRRRAELRAEFDIARSFAQIEESCVPSYCHTNLAAATVAWWRLLVARALYRRFRVPGPILDFGAATGELFHLLGAPETYHWVEENDRLAAILARIPGARRERLDGLPRSRFAAVFALDVLEHNADVPEIVERLAGSLREGGFLVVSGPTENALYRLGRRIAGFCGDYHQITIHGIETVLAARLRRAALRRVYPGLPLFRVSVWTR